MPMMLREILHPFQASTDDEAAYSEGNYTTNNINIGLALARISRRYFRSSRNLYGSTRITAGAKAASQHTRAPLVRPSCRRK